MTGIGLAVALPAVMGYNWLTRANRVLTAKLDAFAFELLTFLSMGRALQAPATRRQRPAACRSAAVQLVAEENGHGFREASTARPRPAPMAEINMVPLIDVDAGAAGDLHRHRAAADQRRQARPAQGDARSADIQKPEKVEFAIDATGALLLERRARSAARTRSPTLRRGGRQAAAARGLSARRPGRRLPLRRARRWPTPPRRG